MTKIIAPGINCFQSFLASILDEPINNFQRASTEHDDWKEQADSELARRGLFYAEVAPGLVSQLPHGALVGARINGVNKPHIVIAKCLREGPRHYFKVEHDPSCKRQAGTPIMPSRIVLLCKLDKA